MWKKGFTLVEMVIVITVIGLLTAYLIPKVTSAQARARDIARKADITAISTALVQYKQDHGSFPDIRQGTGETAGILQNRLKRTSASTLYNEYLSGYLSNIPQDPAKKGFEENNLSENCSTGYCYLSDGKNFILAYAVDNSQNGNYACYDYTNKCLRYPSNLTPANIEDYINFKQIFNNNNNDLYNLSMKTINNQTGLSEILNGKNGFKVTGLTPGYSQNNYFVYIYE